MKNVNSRNFGTVAEAAQAQKEAAEKAAKEAAEAKS